MESLKEFQSDVSPFHAATEPVKPVGITRIEPATRQQPMPYLYYGVYVEGAWELRPQSSLEEAGFPGSVCKVSGEYPSCLLPTLSLSLSLSPPLLPGTDKPWLSESHTSPSIQLASRFHGQHTPHISPILWQDSGLPPPSAGRAGAGDRRDPSLHLPPAMARRPCG